MKRPKRSKTNSVLGDEQGVGRGRAVFPIRHELVDAGRKIRENGLYEARRYDDGRFLCMASTRQIGIPESAGLGWRVNLGLGGGRGDRALAC